METEDISTVMLGDREIAWTFRAMRVFESKARGILKNMEIRPGTYHTGFILAKYLKISEILAAAVAASTGLSAVDGKKGEPSEVSQAIDKYLDEGGSLEELQRAIYMAYLEKNDPSSIPVWLEDVARNEEVLKINQQKAEAKLEIAKMELETDRMKIDEMKRTGSQSTESGM